jgi:hypothetical protein
MSERARRPTERDGSKIFDEAGRQPVAITASGSPEVLPGGPAPFESFELAVTEVTPMPGRAQLEQIFPSHDAPPGPPPAAPVGGAIDAQRSEPIRVISMKDRTGGHKARGAQEAETDDQRVPLQVQLRSIAEVAGLRDSGIGLGNLAPPRDPRQAQARRVRSNVIWASVAIVLACAIMLVVWLVARH